MTNGMSRATPNWGKAVLAGIVATVAITITMLIQGNNILLNLGGMLMPGGGDAAKYVVGGIMHFMIGIVYAIVYAAILGRVSMSPGIKGVLFGLAITAVAMAMMPIMTQMMSGGAAGNPCNPCAAAANPCNPCATALNPCASAGNPCNPCSGAKNPCNPCASAGNPCNPCAGAGNPCNPCGDGGSPYAGLWSMIHHLVYGLVLAFMYKE